MSAEAHGSPGRPSTARAARPTGITWDKQVDVQLQAQQQQRDQQQQQLGGQQAVIAHNSAAQPLTSPCFVHACLDGGLSSKAAAAAAAGTIIAGGVPLSVTGRRYSRDKAPARSLALNDAVAQARGSETPRVSEWGKDVRDAYFPHAGPSTSLGEAAVATGAPAREAGEPDAAAASTSAVPADGSAVPDSASAAAPPKAKAEGSSSRSREQARGHASAVGRYDADPHDSDGSYSSGSAAVEDGDENEEAGSESGSSYLLSSGEEDSDARVRSLTHQLAETAVGVREMSKQLGRARVKSTISSVLIITKARDNQLITLTRELAIWLMRTPRNGGARGVIVYVDAQLKNSKRFDAEGIRRDYPELFEPVVLHPTSHNHHHHSHHHGPRSASFASSTSSVFSVATTQSNDTETASTAGASASTSRGDSGLAGAGSSSTSLPNSATSSNFAHGNGSGNGNGHGLFKGEGQLRYWTAEMCSRHPQLFDFVVTLGGDGTVLFASWMFQRIVPPVLPFSLGSLGFLTNFNFDDYPKVMSSALDDGIRVNLRMRFTATVYRAVIPTSETAEEDRRRAIKSGRTGEIIMRNIQEGGWERIETPCPGEPGWSDGNVQRERCAKRDKEVMCFATRPVETFEVLNDLVVDRGPSPYVSLLEIFGDEHHMTTAQADGICIATPTGSTAYSLAAGGSLAHPEIPAILITPICPHTLSFRPMLLPDSMEVRIVVPYNSRSTAWASFDGRGRVELKQGDHIKVSASRYPFPTVCAENQSIDWFRSISRTLKWNERQRQKSFVVVEEDADQKDSSAAGGRSGGAQGSGRPKENKKSADEKLEGLKSGGNSDEEKFDIQETSQANTRSSSPQPGSGDRLRRRGSTPRSRIHSAPDSAGGTPMASRRSADSMLRLSAMTPAQMTSSLGRSSPTPSANASQLSHLSGKLRATAQAVGAESSGAAQPAPSGHGGADSGEASPAPFSSPDRFGSAGPPEPPQALSERHLATADFRLPPAGASTAVSSGAGGSSTDRSRSPAAVTSAFLAKEKIGPLAAASQAVRGATQALTPHTLLSSGGSAGSRRKKRPASKRSRSSSQEPAHRAAAAGPAPDADADGAQQGAAGRTALVVYGDDDSDSEDGVEEQW